MLEKVLQEIRPLVESADKLISENNFMEAAKRYESAIVIIQAFPEAVSDMAIRMELCVITIRLADCYLTKTEDNQNYNFDFIIEKLQAAIDIGDLLVKSEIVKQDKAFPLFLDKLAHAHHNLGFCYAIGKNDNIRVIPHLEESIKLRFLLKDIGEFEVLKVDGVKPPENTLVVDNDINMAISLASVGNFYKNQKNFKLAIEKLKVAISLKESLFNRKKIDLAAQNMGDILNNYSMLIECYEEENNYELIVENLPKLSQWRASFHKQKKDLLFGEKLSDDYLCLGFYQEKLKNFDAAIAACKEGIELLQRLISERENQPQENNFLLVKLASGYSSLALCYKKKNLFSKIKQFHEAITNYKNAIELLLKINTNNPKLKLELSDNYFAISLCYDIESKFDDAIFSLQKAIELQKAVLESEKDNPTFRTLAMLANSYIELEKIAANRKEFDRAVIFNNDAVKILEFLQQQKAEHDLWLVRLAKAYHRQVNNFKALNRIEEVTASHEKFICLWQPLLNEASVSFALTPPVIESLINSSFFLGGQYEKTYKPQDAIRSYRFVIGLLLEKKTIDAKSYGRLFSAYKQLEALNANTELKNFYFFCSEVVSAAIDKWPSKFNAVLASISNASHWQNSALIAQELGQLMKMVLIEYPNPSFPNNNLKLLLQNENEVIQIQNALQPLTTKLVPSLQEITSNNANVVVGLALKINFLKEENDAQKQEIAKLKNEQEDTVKALAELRKEVKKGADSQSSFFSSSKRKYNEITDGKDEEVGLKNENNASEKKSL